MDEKRNDCVIRSYFPKLAHRLTFVAALCVAASLAACDSDSGSPDQEPALDGDPVYCPKDGPNVYDATELVGLDLKAAEAQAKAERCSVRVVERDGEIPPLTSDLVSNRINVEVRDEVVVRIDGIY